MIIILYDIKVIFMCNVYVLLLPDERELMDSLANDNIVRLKNSTINVTRFKYMIKNQIQ